MLNAAVNVFTHDKDNQKAQMKTLVKCLELSGLVKKDAKGPEYTWYKLPEWLQVEYVQIFGSYMHHQPWYQFPFMEMIQVMKHDLSYLARNKLWLYN